MSTNMRELWASMPADSQAGGDADVQWIQQALQSMGYDPGPVDGVMGGKTIAAIKKFQRDTPDPDTLGPMKADGIVGPKTRRALQNSGGGTPPHVEQAVETAKHTRTATSGTAQSPVGRAQEVKEHAQEDGNQVLDHARDDADKLLDHARDNANKLLDHAEQAGEGFLDRNEKAAEDWIDKQLN